MSEENAEVVTDEAQETEVVSEAPESADSTDTSAEETTEAVTETKPKAKAKAKKAPEFADYNPLVFGVVNSEGNRLKVKNNPTELFKTEADAEKALKASGEANLKVQPYTLMPVTLLK